eukprot:TRINITY_DN848_c0_g1_i13.p1 TRINITY_DN848_c0_g1~~TRINITY_DN848_c0_g1_i13.p1  ORF type:complete len:306 (+),score=60.68 TRINITY_DN848_c0_g1_i13:3-920(+)
MCIRDRYQRRVHGNNLKETIRQIKIRIQYLLRKMQDKKVQWIDVDEEEQQHDLKARLVVEEVKRKQQIPNPDNPSEIKEIEQTVKITKRIFPVRKAVKERKNFTKFGEVSEVPLGTNKQGEVIQEKEANIETFDSQDKQEIDIVNKIKGLNTDVLREKRLQQEIQDAKYAMFEQPEEKPQSKIDSWAKQTQRNIKITNIIFDVANAKDEEEAFKNEIQQHLINKQIIGKMRRPYSLKLIRQKFQDSVNSNLYLAFLSSSDQHLLDQIYEALVEFQYGFTVIQVSWSQTLGANTTSYTRKKGGKYR